MEDQKMNRRFQVEMKTERGAQMDYCEHDDEVAGVARKMLERYRDLGNKGEVKGFYVKDYDPERKKAVGRRRKVEI